MSRQSALWKSPIGYIGLVAGDSGLSHVLLQNDYERVRGELQSRGSGVGSGPLVEEAISQLQEYFNGSRDGFSLPLDLGSLSPFGQAVMSKLAEIPGGEVITYGELAARAGSAGAARAVGRIMAQNSLPLVIPCHRVVPASGSLGGYSMGAGASTKRWLLEFEKEVKNSKNKNGFKSA